jgi:hypothetical protein
MVYIEDVDQSFQLDGVERVVGVGCPVRAMKAAGMGAER